MCQYNCHFIAVLSQDVHTRYRTESHQDVVGRFNERWVLCDVLWTYCTAHTGGACVRLDDFHYCVNE